jgi:low affinity Fe/Cu permease
VSWFDRFADRVEKLVAHAGFFSFCVIVVVVWFPTLFFLDVNTSQLIVNTLTTIVTFLLVALLQNTQERFERAQNTRWCALFEHLEISDPVDDEGQKGD